MMLEAITFGSIGITALLFSSLYTQKGRLRSLAARPALAEAEECHAQSIIASIGEGLLAVDNAGNIITINKTAAGMLRCNREAVIGKSIDTFWTVEDAKGQTVIMDEKRGDATSFLATTTTMSINCYAVLKDKSTLPIALTVAPLVHGGKIRGSVAIFRDRTEENETDRIKSEFVSFASHQLRSPLGITKWYLEAAKEENYLEKVPEKVLFYLNNAYQSNERLIAVVRNLLTVSRIDARKGNNCPTQVDVIGAISKVVKEIETAAIKKNVALKLVIKQSDIPKVRVDQLRFQEVLENLIVNACNILPLVPSG